MNETMLREAVERALKATLPAPEPDSPSAPVAEAMRYSLLAGGKRVRPMLTLAFCALCGEDWHSALPFACGVEMVHTYSLIHDDLPCMDDDSLRRGRPTCHKVYGEAMALLAGDGLLTQAFETVLAFPDPVKAAAAAKCLAGLAGYQGMVGGQCIDLSAGGQEVTIGLLKEMDQGKTVALIDAACRMGCIAAGAGEAQLAAASRYAQGVGMAFQIRDDILDVLGDAETLGKNTGMDAARDKRNYVSLLGVETAQELVESYTGQAVDALGIFPQDQSFLAELAQALANRDS
ncbi:polyprenyl synthetase family protein [Acutalibacter sp.]|jgi:geranylgeranyl diphosphate synthase type II|uniref:polyprenyl synthetase family protein n=1 Tax=Acutalibacter sp. TaxID=1918636 RepID=UPI00216BE592|nr:polyprenyl synthetase family protein [Acutalibacter sp.]